MVFVFFLLSHSWLDWGCPVQASQVILTNAKSELITEGYSAHEEWIWLQPPGGLEQKVYLRVTIQFDQQAQLVDFKSDQARILQKNTTGFVFDTDYPETMIFFSRQNNTSEKPTSYFLRYKVTPKSKPRVWLHSSCKKRGVKVKLKEGKGNPVFYLGLMCKQNKHFLETTVVYSPDAQIFMDNVDGVLLGGEKYYLQFRAEKKKSLRPVAQIHLQSKDQKGDWFYQVLF